MIYPEAVMGERVAHLITSKMIDFIEFDQGFAIAKVRAPQDTAGRSLADIGLRKKHGITVIAVRPPDAASSSPRRRRWCRPAAS